MSILVNKHNAFIYVCFYSYNWLALIPYLAKGDFPRAELKL